MHHALHSHTTIVFCSCCPVLAVFLTATEWNTLITLSAGPSWTLLAVVRMLMIPIVCAHYRRFETLNKVLGYVVISVVTADMIWSLSLSS